MKNGYYLGLDIGTDSVGYAVTDSEYRLKKFHGEPAWGVTLFDEAELRTERRGFRTARRRLDRRQQRVALTRELFAKEIGKIDSRFFIRQQESALLRRDAADRYVLFEDDDYTDVEYHSQYPTIHHLIVELMNSREPHDVRLVYLACAWLVAHRGHFLQNISVDKLSDIRKFDEVYAHFLAFFIDNEYPAPWQCENIEAIGDILKKKAGVTVKERELTALLFDGKRAPKEVTDDCPFRKDLLIKLLCGGVVKPKDLFDKEEYADVPSFSLGMDDEKLLALSSEIGEDFALIEVMRAIYDWTMLNDILGEAPTISKAKVAIYEQHKRDLKLLKHLLKTYVPNKYDAMFRVVGGDNYIAYTGHADETAEPIKSASAEAFSKYTLNILKTITPSKEDQAAFDDACERLGRQAFLPKQHTTDNRVIPHQLYLYELKTILQNAESYLPFLCEQDEDGLSVSDKLIAVFGFRVPYFVGPLNDKSPYAWLERKAGKIYPWNFDKMVDLDKSEEAFIQKLTNTCTYLPGEPVLPKDSLLYHCFMVLNEINTLTIGGVRVPVECKQRIYTELFETQKKVTRKKIVDFLLANGYLEKGQEQTVAGIDITIKADLQPQIAFRRLLASGTLTEADAEAIIERASYAEDKTRLDRFLQKTYPQISADDRKYLCRLKIHDFGRLSRAFLCEVYGTDTRTATGEAYTIIDALWQTQNNLMELLSDRFTFKAEMERRQQEYYAAHPKTLDERLDDLYISNAVRRPIYRTLDIVKDVEKAFGKPAKIFVEMTRGGKPEQKGKRTKSRKEQLLELYHTCDQEDVRDLQQQLDAMGAAADTKLQSDRLFLYYIQLGHCLYTGKAIDVTRLGSGDYNIEHIYPRAFVKDDSILNNEILVDSNANGQKSDDYPIDPAIQTKMRPYWQMLRDKGLITEEKWKRLTRTTPFTDEERLQFINRQLTETSQSTKAVAALLKEHFGEGTEIVYCKAGLVSEFRQEFGLLKSRLFNDLHHASDAYLNIVVGNVYHMKFTSRWFNLRERYSVKVDTLFTHPVICGNETVWNGTPALEMVKKTAVKNNAHLTQYAFCRRSGLFDQMPLSKGEDLIPRKSGLDSADYGGYNKPSVSFFVLVEYEAKSKTNRMFVPVELLYADRVLAEEAFAKEYLIARIQKIANKMPDILRFPLGLRPIKINTMLSLDGFRVCITGNANKGAVLLVQPFMPFAAADEWRLYLKKLEMFVEKAKANPRYVYDKRYDKVSKEQNEALYRLYLKKLTSSIYQKRPNTPVGILQTGAPLFAALPVLEQCQALLNIHQLFGRVSGGVDLQAIGGAKMVASTKISTTLSNWKKTYDRVTIVNMSASGLWEKESDNLLEGL
ncbi:MAG: type II CRISPR RNA-guided endonuclease Cas9 [Clostridia bacterium]|nr:type II CRISPR RNA-guided endonuclease Cas9 [Clostridia bacterium]